MNPEPTPPVPGPPSVEGSQLAGADFDLPTIVPPPPTSANEGRARHLRMDQHRIKGGIEPKPTDKPHQFEVGVARIIFIGEGKNLVECHPCCFLIQRSFQ